MSRRRISILAGVLLLVGAGVAVYFVFRKYRADGKAPVPYRAPKTLVVEAAYPGANAQTVADTVAAPMEEQGTGGNHMRPMPSQSANGDRYRLQISFAAGTVLELAQVVIQNRVNLALPVLP